MIINSPYWPNSIGFINLKIFYQMSIEQHIEKMKLIQNKLIEFICDDEKVEINFQNLNIIFNDLKISENQHFFKEVLHLIIKIYNNYAKPDFLDKMTRIFLIFKDKIKQTFSNIEIFNIFKTNKRILLFLIEEKIFVIDKTISSIMTSANYWSFKYDYFFYPEMKNFLNEKLNKQIESKIPNDFEDKRRTGKNENYICQLIRDDNINEFISYANKSNIKLKSAVEQSIFEANLFLMKNTTLIEYAAFYGSIQIFKYLYKNNVELKPSIWLYSIHGRNAEIIHILEENNVEFPGKSYNKCVNESIKCYQNELVDYFMNNYQQNENENSSDFLSKALKFFNFDYIDHEKVNKSSFFDLCKYDYFILVKELLVTEDIDINAVVILK